jgi:DNA-directed RNA polymerase specialized sigma24 family protein
MPNDINKSIMIEKHINDLKGYEIANKFNMNENTVKTKLRAMRKKI